MHRAVLALLVVHACYVAATGTYFIGLQDRVTEPLDQDYTPQNVTSRAPIVFAGGLGGSALQAKKTNAKEPSIQCSKNTDWYRIWIDISLVIPYVSQPCFVHDIRTTFNGTTKSQQGVQIRGLDYGGVTGVTYLADGVIKQKAKYMGPMFEYLMSKFGYTAGKDLRAATYDWRLGPQEWKQPGGEFSNLKALIENTYEINNNTKVVVMGHSMGANFMQAFLAYFVDQTWKDKYIATLISLGGSYKGVANAYKFIEGDSYSIPLLKSRTMAPIIRQLSSMLWMLPPLDNKDFSVFTPQKNYTNADLKQLIFDLNSTVSWDMYNYQMDSGDRLKSPGVPVHCIYGYDLPTGYGKYFSSLNPPDSEEGKWLSGGDGDSVVPTYSLAACMELAKGQDQPVKEYKLDKAHHVDMVFAPHVWDIITSIVTK